MKEKKGKREIAPRYGSAETLVGAVAAQGSWNMGGTAANGMNVTWNSTNTGATYTSLADIKKEGK